MPGIMDEILLTLSKYDYMPSIFQDFFASSGGKWFNFTNIKGIFWPQPGRNLVKHLKNTVYSILLLEY